MARRDIRSLINLMAVIMEHLYKWEKYREFAYMDSNWKKSILNARKELVDLFDEIPSLKRVAQEKESLNKAWGKTVNSLITWFKEEENLAQKYFSRPPTEEDFPKECPYTFEQIMGYEPWIERR